MSYSHKLYLREERRLTMTFRMQQALAILQMSQQDLSQFIQEEIDKNPLLDEIPKKRKTVSQIEVAATDSIYEHLLRQIREQFSKKEDQQISYTLLEHLDEKGFFTGNVEEIAQKMQIPPPAIEMVLALMKTFEPHGIFAKDLQESLLIQLKAIQAENSSAYMLVKNHFTDLLHHRYSLLKKKYSSLDLAEAIEKLALLQLRPLDSLKKEIISPIVVDLAIRKTETGWTVSAIEEDFPSFCLHSRYDEVQSQHPGEQETIQAWKSQGKWLLNALSRRRKILLQITKRLTSIQTQYLNQTGKLKPFTAQELALELGLHESTISRALAGKYVETPRGIIPLKSLISGSPETKQAKEILQELVEKENKGSPLTDQELSCELKNQGYSVARRTISKYRKELKISSAETRKQFN